MTSDNCLFPTFFFSIVLTGFAEISVFVFSLDYKDKAFWGRNAGLIISWLTCFNHTVPAVHWQVH